MRRVAIVGGGTAGLVCALELQDRCEVTLFEAAPRLGGHVHAVTLGEVAVETGFLAIHRSRYPQLVALFERFGIDLAPTGVGLGIWNEASGEVFDNQAWFQRLAGPARAQLGDFVQRVIRGRLPNERLDTFLASQGYDEAVAREVLWPSIAALWGFQPAEIMAMSARTVGDMLDRFFTTAHREPFERVAPSTDVWLSRLSAALTCRVLHGAVREVRGTAVDGEAFDAVVIATHADTAHQLLADATPLEHEVLGAFTYHRSTSVVHTDASVLPALRREYNYRALGERSFVTWDMRRIQGVDTDVFVTVGPRGFSGLIDPALELARIDYAHPASPPAAVAAREQLPRLQGPHRFYCGSYFGSTGSNECAVASARDAASAVLAVR